MPRYNGPKVRGKLFNISTIDTKRGQTSAKYGAKYGANADNNDTNNRPTNGATNGGNADNNLYNEPFIESSIRPITQTPNNVTRRKQLKQRIGNAINKGNDSFLNNIQHFIESYYPKKINLRGIRSTHPNSVQSRRLEQLKNSEFNSHPIYTNTNSNISAYQLKKKLKKNKPGQVTFKGNVGNTTYNNGYRNSKTYRGKSNIKGEPKNISLLANLLPPPKPPRPILHDPILPDPNIV
jgi:hypothetical protein